GVADLDLPLVPGSIADRHRAEVHRAALHRQDGRPHRAVGHQIDGGTVRVVGGEAEDRAWWEKRDLLWPGAYGERRLRIGCPALCRRTTPVLPGARAGSASPFNPCCGKSFAAYVRIS